VDGLPYKRPEPDALAAFGAILKQSGLSVKVRKRKGSEIDAACGQLRRTLEPVESGVSAAVPVI
jgi:23S rRNA (adenine2503-C2)-methyltransferase